jgi:hypothetical protein
MITVAVEEMEMQSIIENASIYNDEAVEEWEEHFCQKKTIDLIEIKINCERKYLNSGYPVILLEQIIALRNILKERMKNC